MIKKLYERIIDTLTAPDSPDSTGDERALAIRRATTVLMLDVALADGDFDARERERIMQLAAAHFGLDRAETAALVEAAHADAEELVSVYEFTELLHRQLDDDEKASIVELLWRIAYADGQLDKFENSLVLKISDLLYVSRGKVMRLKHDAAQAADAR